MRLFQEALARAGLPPAHLVSWLDVVDRPHVLRQALEPSTVLRLDSPGEDFEVHRRLLALGAARMGEGERGERIAAEDALALVFDGSGLRFARQVHLGFLAALERVSEALAEAGPEVLCTHPPADIAVLCDKRECHARLLAAGVPVAPALAPVDTALELERVMAEARVRAVFAKPRHGSSAAGIAAVRLGKQPVVVSPTGFDKSGAPFSSLRVRRYTRADERHRVLDWLLAEGAHLELWLAKARQGERELDWRVVVVAGRARQVVARIARRGNPMTNLHLGNQRGDVARLRESLGESVWQGVVAAAEAAARCFPRSLAVGVDVMVERRTLAPVVLEVNAFGDLLPGAVDALGLDPWDAQVGAALEQV